MLAKTQTTHLHIEPTLALFSLLLVLLLVTLAQL